MTAKTLADAIRSALTDKVTAAAAEAVLERAANSLKELDCAIAETKAAAFDPLASSSAASAAKSRLDGLVFDRERLAAQIDALRDRIPNLRSEEQGARAALAYEAAKAERDELAALIADRYPALVAEFVDMASRLRANDAMLARVNLSRSGQEWLLGAEAAARGLDGLHRNKGQDVRRITDNQIAPMEPTAALAWPPELNERRRVA